MSEIWAALSGKKTYLIVTIFVACVLLEKFAGIDIPGFDAGDNWMQQVMAMLGIGTLRAGIAGK